MHHRRSYEACCRCGPSRLHYARRSFDRIGLSHLSSSAAILHEWYWRTEVVAGSGIQLRAKDQGIEEKPYQRREAVNSHTNILGWFAERFASYREGDENFASTRRAIRLLC